MATKLKFLPPRKGDLLDYAAQVLEVLSADGFDPTTLGLTADDVTKLGTLLTAAQGADDTANAARMAEKTATQAVNAPGGARDLLVDHLRYIGNAARVSDATDDAVMSIGVSRRDPTPTRKSAPVDAPELTLDGVIRDAINVRFRTKGSSRPRARAPNAKGVQIAIVDGTQPVTDGEADNSPNRLVTRSPASLDSRTMPAQVRLYARWVTERGLTGPWSDPLSVNVD